MASPRLKMLGALVELARTTRVALEAVPAEPAARHAAANGLGLVASRRLAELELILGDIAELMGELDPAGAGCPAKLRGPTCSHAVTLEGQVGPFLLIANERGPLLWWDTRDDSPLVGLQGWNAAGHKLLLGAEGVGHA